MPLSREIFRRRGAARPAATAFAIFTTWDGAAPPNALSVHERGGHLDGVRSERASVRRSFLLIPTRRLLSCMRTPPPTHRITCSYAALPFAPLAFAIPSNAPNRPIPRPAPEEHPQNLRRRHQAQHLPQYECPFSGFDDSHGGLDWSLHHPADPFPPENRFSALLPPPAAAAAFHRDREFVAHGARRRSRNTRGTKEAKKRRDARRNRRKLAAQLLNEQLSRDIDETLTRANIHPPSHMPLPSPAQSSPLAAMLTPPSSATLARWLPPTPPQLPLLHFRNFDMSHLPHLSSPKQSPLSPTPTVPVSVPSWCPSIPSLMRNGGWQGDVPRFFDLSSLPERRDPPAGDMQLIRTVKPKKQSRFFPPSSIPRPTVKLPRTACKLHPCEQAMQDPITPAWTFSRAEPELVQRAEEGIKIIGDSMKTHVKLPSASNLWSILADVEMQKDHSRSSSGDSVWEDDSSPGGGVALPNMLDEARVPAELEAPATPYVHLNCLVGHSNERGAAFASEHYDVHDSGICIEQNSTPAPPIYELSAMPSTPPLSASPEPIPLRSVRPPIFSEELDTSADHYDSEQQLFEATETPLPETRPESPIDLATFLAMGHAEKCWCLDCKEAPELVEDGNISDEEDWTMWSSNDDESEFCVATERQAVADAEHEEELEVSRRPCATAPDAQNLFNNLMTNRNFWAISTTAWLLLRTMTTTGSAHGRITNTLAGDSWSLVTLGSCLYPGFNASLDLDLSHCYLLRCESYSRTPCSFTNWRVVCSVISQSSRTRRDTAHQREKPFESTRMKLATLALMATSAISSDAATPSLSTLLSTTPSLDPPPSTTNASTQNRCGPVCIFFAPDGTCIQTVDGCTLPPRVGTSQTPIKTEEGKQDNENENENAAVGKYEEEEEEESCLPAPHGCVPISSSAAKLVVNSVVAVVTVVWVAKIQKIRKKKYKKALAARKWKISWISVSNMSTVTVATTSTTWDPEFETEVIRVPPGTYLYDSPGCISRPVDACSRDAGSSLYTNAGANKKWGTCSGAHSRMEREGCMTLLGLFAGECHYDDGERLLHLHCHTHVSGTSRWNVAISKKYMLWLALTTDPTALEVASTKHSNVMNTSQPTLSQTSSHPAYSPRPPKDSRCATRCVCITKSPDEAENDEIPEATWGYFLKSGFEFLGAFFFPRDNYRDSVGVACSLCT
ncbi:uncharacterized protein MYCFIDRAFT_179808 [Pseudocercospora fijiensis CIRAD86]|uniref:Uncharacterized protein n=1 Tax=Pseudocercospora fijiensis (strain CIRAD86) TaxID=383855 RepID=M2ZYN6_PSEFD|nr:uncharacterized protein MYCFIDRAFT_179808 [Pseudocercospora fijiensis CIRAD86]EME77226.1 hypothetical protein MYCFIDRAFT_179808 [Pseudocercospora fijiensis CIRAD86]